MPKDAAPNIQLESLLSYVQADNRVSPRLLEWQALWESLTKQDDSRYGTRPGLLLVLAASSSSNAAKAERFEGHIRWAAQQGYLDAADKYIRALSDQAWDHSGRREPNVRRPSRILVNQSEESLTVRCRTQLMSRAFPKLSSDD